jgi:hypothetical protein
MPFRIGLPTPLPRAGQFYRRNPHVEYRVLSANSPSSRFTFKLLYIDEGREHRTSGKGTRNASGQCGELSKGSRNDTINDNVPSCGTAEC